MGKWATAPARSHAVAGIMCSQAHEKGRRLTFDRQKLEIV
jgi:hypothetical protein